MGSLTYNLPDGMRRSNPARVVAAAADGDDAIALESEAERHWLDDDDDDEAHGAGEDEAAWAAGATSSRAATKVATTPARRGEVRDGPAVVA